MLDGGKWQVKLISNGAETDLYEDFQAGYRECHPMSHGELGNDI